MLSSARQQVLIVSIAALVLLANLGSATLFDEDEPKNAACGAEMFARGDWIVPTFNHELRTDKPVLLYWLMLSSYHVLGVNELAARLPSALLAIGTVLMVYHLGRLLYRPQVGFWAAIILATSLMFDVVGRASTPDSTLIFFITAGALAYVRGVAGSAGWLSIADGDATLGATAGLSSSVAKEPARHFDPRWRRYLPRSIGWWIAMYALLGLAVLTKGPVGVVLPIGVLATFLLVMAREPRAETGCASNPPGWRSRVRAVCWTVADCLRPSHVVKVLWALRPMTGMAVVALVALPWYLAVGLETDGQWLAGFLGKHNVNRFLQPLEGHRGTIFYHPAVVHVTFFPWSMLLLLTLVTWWRRVHQRDAIHASDLFVACWAATYFVFFSLCRTKLPNYVLPAYPALALLTGVFLDCWIARPREVSRKLVALALGTYVCVGIGLVVVLPIVAYILLPGETLLCLIGLIPLVGGALAWRFAMQERITRAVHTLMVMGVVFAVALFSVAAVRVARHQTSAGFATVAREQVGPAADWVTLNHFEPGLVFYSGNQVRHFDSLDAFEQQVAQSRNPVLLVRDKDLDQVRARLPGGFRELARQRRFLRRHDLVLLARPDNLARASRTGNRQSR
ncbi:MAG: glycosyltransferase family 39 protein [Pirellulales bacterium]|nr:glycosyltransferase family 39 protein [Pirellulales bacterium]